jgi:hypothetical protein
MPGSDDYGQDVPYPKLSDQPNIEAALSALVNALVPLSNMIFANANERAASLPAPVVGMETFLVAEGRKEYYNGSAWVPLTPGQWQPLSFATGYVANSGSPSYRVLNGEVQFRGTIKLSSGADLPNAVETLFATVPVGARPVGAPRIFAAAGNFVTSGGVSHFTARVGVDTDGLCKFIVPTGSTMEWLSLDGIRYSIS